MQLHASALMEMRLATQEIHESLESSLAVARPDATRSDYECYLQDLWGWLQPFEAQLWDADWPTEAGAGERANKLAWIESDLRASRFDDEAIAAIPICPYKPNLDCMYRRFGVAYVVEGAQLGTKVLGKRLAPRLSPWSPRWLAGYGERNGRSWRTFVECAERHLDSAEAREAASLAAAEAFASLAQWFASRQRERRLRDV